MQGIHKVHAAAVPFVSMFYGTASTYLWEDDEGTTHKIVQGEGGEQGDAMMPLLFSLGQHPALEAVQAQLFPGEFLFAYLDDIYVVCAPERTGTLYTLLQDALWRVAGIRIHQGKTKIWNRLGVKPEICDALERMARIEDPTACVWRGSGAHRASGHQGVGHTSWPQGTLSGTIWRGHQVITNSCWTGFPCWRICSPLGCSWCIVPLPVPIT